MAPKKPRVTSSSNRSTRSTTKPVTKGQNPQRANRQKVSQAKVTTDTTRGPSPGRYGQNKQRPGGLANSGGTGRVTGTAGRPKPANPPKVTTGSGRSAMDVAKARGKAEVAKAQVRRNAKAASQRMSGVVKAAKTARDVLGVVKNVTRGGAFAAGIQANNTAKGTLSEARQKYGDKAFAQKQGPSQKTTTSSFNKKTFDQAFKAARSSGAKEFTWRGKKYNTKMKGE